MKKMLIIFIVLLLFTAHSEAGDIMVEDDSAMAAQQAPTDGPVSTHKVNYFSINHLPGNNKAQVKFQLSMKFRVLEPNLYVLKHNIFPAFIGYTQTSLWNEGLDSIWIIL